MSFAWDNYSESYNLLSAKMRETGIDISLLDDVVVAYEKVLKGNMPTVLSTHLSNINLQNVLDRKPLVAK